MSNDRWREQCELCGRSIDVSVWTDDHDQRFCTQCQIDFDDEQTESVYDQVPVAEDWSEAGYSVGEEPGGETEFLWAEEDRDWEVERYYAV